MTRSEARKALTEALPTETTFCITIQDWRHAGLSPQMTNEVEYRVSLLPGLNGEKCYQFNGRSIDACVGQALDAIKEWREGSRLDAEFAEPGPQEVLDSVHA